MSLNFIKAWRNDKSNKRVLIWHFTLVLIKINYGQIGDQTGLFYTTNPVFYTSGNRFVRRTGTFGNLIFSLVPSDNRNTRSTCPTSVFTGTGQSDKRQCRGLGRGPSNDYFIKVWFQLSNWFQTRRFLWEFPKGSYVKLGSAVAAILVGGLKCRTQIWKGTTQGSFQQSLVEIGSEFQRRRFFFNFIPSFFYFSLAAIFVGSRDHRTQLWKGAIQGPLHQSLVAIGPVVSEEKILM